MTHELKFSIPVDDKYRKISNAFHMEAADGLFDVIRGIIGESLSDPNFHYSDLGNAEKTFHDIRYAIKSFIDEILCMNTHSFQITLSQLSKEHPIEVKFDDVIQIDLIEPNLTMDDIKERLAHRRKAAVVGTETSQTLFNREPRKHSRGKHKEEWNEEEWNENMRRNRAWNNAPTTPKPIAPFPIGKTPQLLHNQ